MVNSAGKWLLGLIALAWACFLVPIYVIRPFRGQGQQELAVALEVLRWGPAVALLAAVAGVGLAAVLWRRRPVLAGLGALLVMGGRY